MNLENLFEQLKIIDPDLTSSVVSILMKKKSFVCFHEAEILEQDTVWAMCHDIELGQLVATGYAHLICHADSEKFAFYHELIKTSCKKGLNLGRMMAKYWVPVLCYGNQDIIDRFSDLIRIMRKRGEYTLKKPLNLLSELLEKKEHGTALGFIGLLTDTFSQNLPYKQSLYLARLLPETIQFLNKDKRSWQISQIRRVIRMDFQLADPFINALKKGLYLLSENSLRIFVTKGLEKFEHNENLGTKFLSLESKMGMDTYKELLVTVSLTQIKAQLNRYLRARTGLNVSIQSISKMPKVFFKSKETLPEVCSDGKFIYLTDEISIFSNKNDNKNLYKCLTKLESAFYEFQTFDFDLEKVLNICQINSCILKNDPANLSDMEQFCKLFPIPALASDLFNIFEQARIRILLKKFYPGIVRTSFSMLINEANQMKETNKSFMMALYCCIALGDCQNLNSYTFKKELKFILNNFNDAVNSNSQVEICAKLTFDLYPQIEAFILKLENSGQKDFNYLPFKTPFDRKLRPDLFFASFKDYEKIAKNIKIQLQKNNLNAYKSDIKKQLIKNNGKIGENDLCEIVFPSNDSSQNIHETKIDLSWLNLSEIMANAGMDSLFQDNSSDCPVFWYKEWDFNLGDYLHDHTRVLDKFIPEISGNFYDKALNRYYGLVQIIRRAFELLRPEGINILRQWVEGDEFDYRAMLDFAIDKKAGIMPSDRLYIKRIKHQRDVAVMLLVDMSKSTSNRVFESQFSVLDVEKEAIVLFCEALEVVGDTFAISGFSGTGRLSVDYFHIKDFHEPVTENVKARINAMSPQRSTRMGAAIRHACTQFKNVEAKIRILIILGDGFPNDTNYKREYAIYDTRKAIAEARSQNIHTKAITVNIMGDSKLDDLYGSMHHNIISDVRQLPDKLLRIYSSLTR